MTITISLQAPPRAVHMSRHVRFFVIGIACTLLGFSALLLAMGVGISLRQSTLKQHGVSTLATIKGKHIEYDKGDLVYKIDYTYAAFDTVDGRVAPFQNEQVTSKIDFDTLAIGNPAPLLYDPRNPTNAKLNVANEIRTSDPNQRLYTIVEALGMVVVIMITIAFGIVGFFYFPQRHLLRWGETVPATILGQQRLGGGSGWGFSYIRLTYHFTDQEGRLIEGSRGDNPIEPLVDSSTEFAEIIANPTVFYDPKNSRRHLLYPPLWATLT